MTTDKRLKLWGLLLALLIASGACFAQKKGNLKAYETEDEDRLQMLYGQVKSIKEARQYPPFTSQQIKDIYTYNYDKQGKILEYKLLMSDSDVWDIGQYEYNTDGLKVNSWIFVRDATNEDTISRSNYKYDERGFLLEKRTWKERYGEVLYRSFYNDKGQLERRVSYRDEAVFHSINYVYNEAGQLEKAFDPENEQQLATYYKYSVQGQLIVQYFVVGKFRQRYEYDSNGCLEKETRYWTNELDSSTKYYTYTYDKQGNWISRETYIEKPGEEKILYETSTREITYY